MMTRSVSMSTIRASAPRVTVKIARKVSLISPCYSRPSAPQTSRFNTCTRSQTLIFPCQPPRVARCICNHHLSFSLSFSVFSFSPSLSLSFSHVHSVSLPHPSQKIDKNFPLPACFSYVSIHTTCQPIVNHYCTFFRVYDILYFTFFNYFLFVNIRRAVSTISLLPNYLSVLSLSLPFSFSCRFTLFTTPSPLGNILMLAPCFLPSPGTTRQFLSLFFSFFSFSLSRRVYK